MGLKVADLRRDKRTIVIPIEVGENDDGEEIIEDLTVTYRPSEYTPDMEEALNEKIEGKWKSAMGIEFVTRLIIEWDIVETGEGGFDSTVPLTEAGLRPLPNDFIGQVVLGVSKDMGKRRQASSDT